ncbi:MAG: prephenate dehydratase [Xanthomonadales bacterium]|nr:prephenate dehydratase [Xanthomonadales bacterium]
MPDKTNSNDKHETILNLDSVRGRIDGIDREIQQLISARASLALEVGKVKGKLANAVDYYRPDREAQVLRRVCENNKGPLSDEEMLRLFREIMSACLAQQEPLTIAYLGPEGTFTQQAVSRHFGHSIHSIAMAGIEDIFHQVQSEDADFGVVPVENSTQGVVSHTMDMFYDSDIKICGEITLRIHQNLLTHAKSLDQIERVYSHQQSLSQCRHWLRANLPNAECIAVSSNAEAARRARNAADSAAIASRAAGRIYDLPILFSRIEDQQDNSTRFLVLGRELFPPSGNDKTSLMMATRGGDGPGDLYSLLAPLNNKSINMTRIESRPSRESTWGYVFFVDVLGHADEEPLKSVLNDLSSTNTVVRVLGSYPQAMLDPEKDQ